MPLLSIFVILVVSSTLGHRTQHADAMCSLCKSKPYSAITVQINRLTSEQYEVDDMSGIVDLIEVIRLQTGGPTEAARAIRKKLKYGSVDQQLRALTILDGLMENAGPRFQRAFADEPLLERLRVCATDSLSDSEVKKKCQTLFRQWAVAYQSTPGMERIVALQKQLPKRKKPVTQAQSRVLRETEREANEDPFGDEDDDVTRGGANSVGGMGSQSISSSSPGSVPLANLNSTPKHSSKSKTDRSSKKHKRKTFSLEKEKPEITRTIAESSIASINLMNALKLLNRENIRVSEHAETVTRFEKCKANRRQILRYIQHIETGDLLGGLIQANDQLVEALMSFEILDKSVDDDSDSDGVASDAEEPPAKPARTVPNQQKDTQEALSKLSLGKAPTPLARPHPTMQLNGKGGVRHDDDEDDEEEDEEEEEGDNPFGDSHAVHTPKAERPGMTWREV